MGHVTRDAWHMTRDTWQVTCDTFGEVNILSKFQLPSSYRLEVTAVQSFSYEIALLLSKYAGLWANFVNKKLKFLEKNIILV